MPPLGEGRFRAVLEAAPDAMLTVADDGRITMVNSEAERLFGYEREALIGQLVEILLPERARVAHRRYRDQYRAHPRRRPMGLGLNLVGRRRDGSEFPTEISLSPLQGDAGLSVIVVVRDITERKRIEEERAALVREQAARAEAEAANRAKDEFVAMVSHELRTPLNAILGWATLMQAHRDDAEVVDRAVSAIERNARVQRQVIDDLLDVSAMTSRRMPLDLEEVDVARILAAAEESVRPSADLKGVTLRVDVEESLPHLVGDARRLQQVFWNLLVNAVKFTPGGGRVVVSARLVDGHEEFRVSDSGAGIDPTFLPHVFDRFRQQDGTASHSSGLGLGLAIVHELVQRHGGTVTAESEGEGRGATFTVTLPVRAVLPIEGAAVSNAVASPAPVVDVARHPYAALPYAVRSRALRGLRAIVVDDDAESLQMLNEVLQRAGATVTAVPSAAAALHRLTTEGADVVISDLAMPGLDGFGFMATLRRLGLTIPAVALTAHGRPQDHERTRNAGFRVHLTKPVQPDDLVELVARVTGRGEPTG